MKNLRKFGVHSFVNPSSWRVHASMYLSECFAGAGEDFLLFRCCRVRPISFPSCLPHTWRDFGGQFQPPRLSKNIHSIKKVRTEVPCLARVKSCFITESRTRFSRLPRHFPRRDLERGPNCPPFRGPLECFPEGFFEDPRAINSQDPAPVAVSNDSRAARRKIVKNSF